MARRATTVLDSRTARLELKPRKQPYYVQVAPRVTLGYVRHDPPPGTWIMREKTEDGYRREKIGTADDVGFADGKSVLAYIQARERAANGDASDPGSAEPLSVKRAVERYLAALEARKGSAAATDARQRAEKHIDPTLGKKRVTRLTKRELEEWLGGMVREDPDDPDAHRRSRDSANRVLTILKAALNHAFADDANRISTDSAWRRVKAFKGVATEREDHFDATQVRTLIAKAVSFDRPFANLIEAAYLTGARLGELAALDVRDFDAANAVLMIRKGKTGARPVTLTGESVAFFTRIAKGRLPGAALLPRGDGDRWGKSEQHRPFKRAAKAASLPSSASFYTLRHSHISRAIEAGMPLSLVAENCGTSLTMIERNYAKVLAATRRKTIERTAPRLRRVK